MSQLKLWLIRHGESSINSGIWSPNPANAQLTALGKKQAQEVAAKIRIPPDLIITSPMLRAQESAQYIIEDWPQSPNIIWPIQELIYLSPSQLQHLSPLEKKSRVNEYWQRNDPLYCDGQDAESFASFLQRVAQFHQNLRQQKGFVIAIGHGQFFKAYQLGLFHGFMPTSEWMKMFRQQETSNPMKNSELIEILF